MGHKGPLVGGGGGGGGGRPHRGVKGGVGLGLIVDPFPRFTLT